MERQYIQPESLFNEGSSWSVLKVGFVRWIRVPLVACIVWTGGSSK